ncbi:MAG TPA: hypothetical protein VHC69_03170 [Polyangiaceae bacterium]|nr:hypothetical protein [Polyangiaceae bacterium]
MANEDDATEAWGRRSRVPLEKLPHADPIAYLGTERHPVSIPPTTHDVDSSASMSKGADTAKKSHASRRILASVIGLAILLPMAVSLSSSDDVAKAPPIRAAAPPPQSPEELARKNAQAVPMDLPPGGVSDGPLPEGEPPLSSQQSVADWKQPPSTPTASERSESMSVSTTPSQSSGEAPASSSSAAAELHGREPTDVKPTTASVPRATRRRAVAALASPFDFSAAMNAVASTNIGPVQCGPDAIGATPVAITFSPSGQATHAVIENGSLRGTETGSCIARELRKVRIPPFDGDTATVRTSVLLR